MFDHVRIRVTTTRFPATENRTVDAFHDALTDEGVCKNGMPGEARGLPPGYSGAFVLDPDGNNVGVVSHNRVQ